MRGVVRILAVVAAAVACWSAAVAGVASAAPPWVDGPTYGQDPLYFDLAVTPDGGVTAAWSQLDGRAFAQRTPAGASTSAPPVALGPAGGDARLAAVAPGAGDASLVLYVDEASANAQAVRIQSVASDGSAGPEQTLAENVVNVRNGGFAFAGDGAGGALATWVAGDGDPRLFARRALADGTLGPVVDLGAVAWLGSMPKAALLPDGTGRAVWLAGDTYAVMAARLTPTGELDGPPQQLTPDGVEALEPVLATSAYGAVVAWQGTFQGSYSRKEVQIARLPSSGAVAEPPQTVAFQRGNAAPGTAVALADDGTVTTTWTDAFTEDGEVGVLRLARIAADGRPGPIALLSEPDGELIDTLPRLVPTGDGALHAIWARTTNTSDEPPTAMSRAIAADGAVGPESVIAAEAIAPPIDRPYAAGADAAGSVTAGFGVNVGDGWVFATASIDSAPPRIEADGPATAVVGEPVGFRAVVTDPAGVASLRWAFGDGSGSDNAVATHVYADAGSYEVSLTAIDGLGNAGVVRRTVTVTARPANGGDGGDHRLPVDPPGPPGPLEPPAPPAPRTPADTGQRSPSKAAAALRFASVERRGARVRVAGTISRRARGWVTVTWSQRGGRGAITRSVRATIVRGRFVATVRLSRALARSRAHGRVTLTYAGDADTRAAEASKRIAPPRRGARR